MNYDTHVHIALWHRHDATDRFLRSWRNWPVRAALRPMGATTTVRHGRLVPVCVGDQFVAGDNGQ